MISFAEPYFLAAAILSAPAIYLAVTRERKHKRLTAVTKALTILLITFALASPSVTVEEERSQENSLVILEDSSRSAKIIEDSGIEFEDIETERRTIATGNSSDLSSGILRHLEEDRSFLLVSDLRSSSSLQRVIQEFNRKNSTINILKPDTQPESAVTVEGPETTHPGVKSEFLIHVSSTENSIPQPSVKLDGERVETEKVEGAENSWSFSRTFEEEGSHTIEASIETRDRFSDNNQYFKTVEVSEKPEILILGDRGRIAQEFSEFYSFDNREQLPEDLSPYYAVIAKKEFEEADIASYTAEGNGVVYTGSNLEQENTVLPIRKTEYKDQGIKMMLLIDASEGGNPEERLKRTKKIAYLLLDSETLPDNSQVGALYYNQDPHIISKPRPLGEDDHREKLQGGITNIPVGGNNLHYRAIRAGQQMIDGEGNLLLITDGTITALGEYYNETRNSRELARESEERIISVKVGQEPNHDYLEEVASLSGGFAVSDARSQEIQFQGGGSSSEAVSLIKNDNTHFITRGIEVEGSATGFYGAEPKPGARQLVSASNGQPFLTAWRYGIGRVAAFSGGQEDLGTTMYQDSELVSRTLSWAVGDPQRKQDRNLDIEDAQYGETVQVSANYPVEGLNRQGENLYTGEVETSGIGFHRFQDTVYSYNYNDEVEKVGYSGAEEIALETGGQVFTPDQKDEIKDTVQEFNSEKVKTQKDLTMHFLATALIVFLSEIGYRKRRGKK